MTRDEWVEQYASAFLCDLGTVPVNDANMKLVVQFARDAMAVADQTKPRPYCKLHDSGYEHCADQTRQEDGADERRLAVGVADVQPLPSKLSDAPAPTTDAPREHPDLRGALEQIAKYGKDGICPYGCDCPNIAKAALAASEKPVVEEVVTVQSARGGVEGEGLMIQALVAILVTLGALFIGYSCSDGKEQTAYLVLTTVDILDPAFIICYVPADRKVLVMEPGKKL